MALHQKDRSGYESIPVMTNFFGPSDAVRNVENIFHKPHSY